MSSLVRESKYDSIASDYAETVDLINDLDTWVYSNNLPTSRNRILDIGCGTGSILSKLSQHFRETYGIDHSAGMLIQAKRKIPKGKFTKGDGNNLPYKADFFDMVISHAVFHYLNREAATKEAVRVLTKSGKLVIAEVVSVPPLEKIFEKLIYRHILTKIRLVLANGLHKTNHALKFIYGNYWQTFANKNQNNLPSLEFKSFYGRLLPGAKFGIANYRIHYLVWTKP